MLTVNESGNFDQFVPYPDVTFPTEGDTLAVAWPDHADCSDMCTYGGREATYCPIVVNCTISDACGQCAECV
jgi:hypothetical protein